MISYCPAFQSFWLVSSLTSPHNFLQPTLCLCNSFLTLSNIWQMSHYFLLFPRFCHTIHYIIQFRQVYGWFWPMYIIKGHLLRRVRRVKNIECSWESRNGCEGFICHKESESTDNRSVLRWQGEDKKFVYSSYKHKT